MGAMVSARCECGFETRTMFLGGGMLNFTTVCTFPFYCVNCSILFESNMFKKKVACPQCHMTDNYPYDSDKAFEMAGKNNVFSWNVRDKIDKELVLTDGNYICPACRKFTLKFFDVGCWD